MKKIVVILAAGLGKRVGEDLPKQWILIHGKPIIEYTIAVFHANPQIDEISVVLSPDFAGKLGDYIDLEQYPKIKAQIE
ncbi:MAG TPA: 2-C-methyl-D-erythritol 4-phosphate cytidylyltransferase, partial [Bacteroidales bacterium]|nr:2-C-methyl-D-erythritol 4-phosphate cytidylyltransferase [Bacteroidales bacterium]